MTKNHNRKYLRTKLAEIFLYELKFEMFIGNVSYPKKLSINTMPIFKLVTHFFFIVKNKYIRFASF
jgi:hypothetical protein